MKKILESSAEKKTRSEKKRIKVESIRQTHTQKLFVYFLNKHIVEAYVRNFISAKEIDRIVNNTLGKINEFSFLGNLIFCERKQKCWLLQ